MKVYIFKDVLGEGEAEIIAPSHAEAVAALKKETTINFKLIDTRPLPIEFTSILNNTISPF